MKKKIVTAISVVVCLAALATTWLQPPKAKPRPSANHAWLVQLYPPGYCLENQCNNTARATTQRFSVHGLWPADIKGATIPGDPTAPDADSNKIKANGSLADEMDIYWPNMNGDNFDANFGFWAHEWKNHGSADLAYNRDAMMYFKKVIALMKLPGANLTASLEKHNIYPGRCYDKGLYVSAMVSGNGVPDSIVLRCYTVNNTDHLVTHLAEVRACVNSSSTSFIACLPKEIKKDSCGTGLVKY